VCEPSSRLCPSARAAASPWVTPRRAALRCTSGSLGSWLPQAVTSQSSRRFGVLLPLQVGLGNTPVPRRCALRRRAPRRARDAPPARRSSVLFSLCSVLL
jgi:hypothetical protein